jgi:hypothetical protein
MKKMKNFIKAKINYQAQIGAGRAQKTSTIYINKNHVISILEDNGSYSLQVTDAVLARFNTQQGDKPPFLTFQPTKEELAEF